MNLFVNIKTYNHFPVIVCLLFCLLYPSAISFSSLYFEELVIPYQSCNPNDVKFTSKLVSQTEAGFCYDCRQGEQDSVKQVMPILDIIDNVNIPKLCFLSMAIKGKSAFSSKQYTYCEDEKSRNFSRRRKACINEDYVNMIHESFSRMSRCFNFDVDKQKDTFFLITQESKGILNVLSHTGASCLGQVTYDYVKHINNIIKYSDSPINKVFEKCPFLNNHIIDDMRTVDCATTQNPYTCLLYTFFGLEENLNNIKKNLNSDISYMGTRDFSEKERKLYKVPVKLNEILSVKAKLSNGKEIDYVLWDELELYNVLRNMKARGVEILNPTVKKIPLFENEEDIETMFSYWSHNGGQALSGNMLISTVEELKKNISRSCKDPSPRCSLREKIQNGKSLSAIEVLPFFEDHIKQIYPDSMSRKIEVSQYVKNIKRTNRDIFHYDKSVDMMRGKYQTAFRHRTKGLELSRNDADRFHRHISDVCPKLDKF